MSVSIYSNSSFSDSPYGLKLQQTLTTSGSVTIPDNIRRVYAICIGGGGSGGSNGAGGGGGAGGYSAGWTYATDTCIVGLGGGAVTGGVTGNNGKESVYGMVIGGGGGGGAGIANPLLPSIGGGGGGGGKLLSTGNNTSATASAISYTGAPSALSLFNGYGGGVGGGRQRDQPQAFARDAVQLADAANGGGHR